MPFWFTLLRLNGQFSAAIRHAAILNGTVLADSDDIVMVDGNLYPFCDAHGVFP